MDSDVTIVFVYHCWLCSMEFLDKLGIVRHLKMKHADVQELKGIEKLMKAPICLECGQTGPCEHKYRDVENNQDTPEEEFEEDNFEVEDSNVSRPRVIPCSNCEEPFPDTFSLREHRQKEHPDDKSYQCAFCVSTFLKHSHLVVHTRIHTGSRPYICTECGSRFPKSSDLKRHARVHSGEKPYKCALCSQGFTQKCSLEKHAKIHAKHIGGQPCLMCGLVFTELDSLGQHMQANHLEVTWKCQLCGKMFAEERHMLLHEKSHISVKAFSCGLCPKSFSTRTMLLKHEESIHSTKREIKCFECGKEFKRRENLTRHMFSHTGVKNHTCTICGVAFTEKGSLTRHTKSQHDQIRPHVCMICARAFTRKILLRKHMERVHANKSGKAIVPDAVYFRCKLCQKLLKKSGISQHIKHHRKKGDKWDGSIQFDDDATQNNSDNELDEENTDDYEPHEDNLDENETEDTKLDESDNDEDILRQKDDCFADRAKPDAEIRDSDSTIEYSDIEAEKAQDNS